MKNDPVTPDADTPTVLIAEGNVTGHGPYYIRLLAEEALAMGHRVVIATHHDADPEDAVLGLSDLSDAVEKVVVRDWTVKGVAEISRAVSAGRTVLSGGDRFALRIALSSGWRGAGRLSVLIMREVAQPDRVPGLQAFKTAVRRALFRRANSFSNVRVVVLKSAWWSGVSEFSVARDPITLGFSPGEPEQVAREWGLSEDRYWFAILGVISARKNVDLVARALAHVESPARLGLLVGGAWDADIGPQTVAALQDLADAGAQVVTVNRRLQDSELDAAVARADCLVVAHSNEGPSGLLGKAAAAGTRVVASGAQSLREDMRRLPGLGEWVELEESVLAESLGEAVHRPQPASQLDQNRELFTRALL